MAETAIVPPGGKQLIIVAAVIRHRFHPNRVLLTQRGPHGIAPNMWHFAGGKMEYGELSFADRLVLEMRQETHVEVQLLDALPVWITNVTFTEPVHRHVVGLHYRAEIIDGEPRPGDDTQAVQWASREDACRIRDTGLLLPSSREVMQRVLGWVV